MAKVVQILNGIPTLIEVTAGTISFSDEGVLVDANVSAINVSGGGVVATQTSPGNVKLDVDPNFGVPIWDVHIDIVSGSPANDKEIQGAVTPGTDITLPDSQNYEDSELMIWINGQFQEPGVDYDYIGVGSRTQIEFITETLQVGDVLRMRIDTAAAIIYDESIDVSSAITTGTPISLPSAQAYDDDELEVWLNGKKIEHIYDYNYEGVTVPRTQVSFTFDLEIGDRIRFRIDRDVI